MGALRDMFLDNLRLNGNGAGPQGRPSVRGGTDKRSFVASAPGSRQPGQGLPQPASKPPSYIWVPRGASFAAPGGAGEQAADGLQRSNSPRQYGNISDSMLPSSIYEQMHAYMKGDQNHSDSAAKGMAVQPPAARAASQTIRGEDLKVLARQGVDRSSTTKPDSFWDRVQGAAEHLQDAATRVVKEGWNPSDPLGYDPETKMRLHEAAMAHPALRPVEAFNNVIGYPATAAADAVLRVGNVALHGGAALAGQAANEVGLGNGRALERDLLGMAEMSAGSAGGLAGMPERISTRAAVARPVVQMAENKAKNYVIRTIEAPTAQQYYKGAKGNTGLGWIGADVEAASEGRVPQGQIRMNRGYSVGKAFGVRHISADKHKRAQHFNYKDGLAAIEDGAANYEKVYEQKNGRLLLVKPGEPYVYLVPEYRQSSRISRFFGKDDPYYSVVTGFTEDAKKKNGNYLRRSIKKGEVTPLIE